MAIKIRFYAIAQPSLNGFSSFSGSDGAVPYAFSLNFTPTGSIALGTNGQFSGSSSTSGVQDGIIKLEDANVFVEAPIRLEVVGE